jgi:Arc/MetJ-type ribon-helix-helix transcriptional regulator
MSDAIAVKLPFRMKEEIDELIRLGVFVSRSDVLKFGARLVIMLEKMELPLSARAEEYALEEIAEKFKRVKNVH